MTSGIPYLGSKISLIPKSEIRYEGILYTIDTKESTVALAKGKGKFSSHSQKKIIFTYIFLPFVWLYDSFFASQCTILIQKYRFVLVRSYGTEDRPTDRPVAPRDETYEYIIFRGADIKDIRVCQPPKPRPTLEGGLPNDPAIVQVRTEVVKNHSGKLANPKFRHDSREAWNCCSIASLFWPLVSQLPEKVKASILSVSQPMEKV